MFGLKAEKEKRRGRRMTGERNKKKNINFIFN